MHDVSGALAPSGLTSVSEREGEAGSRRRSGGIAEFLLVGGVTPLLFPLSWLLRRHFGLSASDEAVGFLFFYGAYLINDPHFAVTYLLFYKDIKARAFGRGQLLSYRARYVVAGLVVPVLLCGWAASALATRSAVRLGVLIQVMFFLVGWHYVKQGFGTLVVLAARRAVRFSTIERRALLAHCYAAWAYAWASPADRGTVVEEKGVVYTTLAHGATLERATHVAFLLTGLLVVGVLLRKWRRERRLPLTTGLVAWLSTIWSWTIYSSVDPLVRYVTPALHSMQYLYFVGLLKGNEASEREGAPWFQPKRSTRLATLTVGAVTLGWFFFHGAPAALDFALVPQSARATDLGPTPYFAALYAIVNIHHYAMDAVLWRHEEPTTRYLYADLESTPP
jgi:hypothetical protein